MTCLKYLDYSKHLINYCWFFFFNLAIRVRGPKECSWPNTKWGRTENPLQYRLKQVHVSYLHNLISFDVKTVWKWKPDWIQIMMAMKLTINTHRADVHKVTSERLLPTYHRYYNKSAFQLEHNCIFLNILSTMIFFRRKLSIL